MIQLKIKTASKFCEWLDRSELIHHPREKAIALNSILMALRQPVELTDLYPLIQWWVMKENLKNVREKADSPDNKPTVLQVLLV